MRAAPPRFDFAVDAPRDMVPGKEFRRTAGILIALRVSPALFLAIGGLGFIEIRNVIEHEALPFTVPQHAAFTAHAFRHEDSGDADGPDHPGRMELHELHIEVSLRAGRGDRRGHDRRPCIPNCCS